MGITIKIWPRRGGEAIALKEVRISIMLIIEKIAKRQKSYSLLLPGNMLIHNE